MRYLAHILITLMLLIASAYSTAQCGGPVPQLCDADGDFDVDSNDIAAIGAAKGSPSSGPGDLRDVDGDGMITVLDARKCVAYCTNANCDGGESDYTPAVGVLLYGAPTDLAMDALEPKGPLPAEPGDIEGSFLLTRLDLTLRPEATVQQINAALAAVEGGIVGMLPGESSVVVAVPRQADGAALEALAATLAAQPGVRFAFAGRSAVVREAPPTPADAEDKLRYLHDQRFVAAWNARAAGTDCSGSRVTVIAPDNYLRGNEADFSIGYANLESQLPGITFPAQPAGNTLLAPHGFDVLSTLAAKWDEIPPTGAFPYPECLDIRPIETSVVSYVGISLLIASVAPATGNFIVTHSWGYPSCLDPATCDPADPRTYDMQSAQEMGKVAAEFKKVMLRFPDRMLTVSAAGNDKGKPIAALYPGLGQAAYDSPMNAASRGNGEMTWVGDPTLWAPTGLCTGQNCPQPLTATLAQYNELKSYLLDEGILDTPAPPVILVGSAEAGGFNAPAGDSEPGEDVYAIGEAVPTISKSFVKGTSFASPQVSALAAYLWQLSPELAALPISETIAAIKANVCTLICAGLIDAYATVLALDSGQALSPQNSRIRLAILDVDGNGGFDLADLVAYLAAFRPDGEPLDPIEPDYSRHDLNGDGFTGGTNRSSFDLDPTGSPRFRRAVLETVAFEFAGEPVIYNEAGVTDEEILCYYAYSPLYAGDDLVAREDLLTGICNGEGEEEEEPIPPGTYAGTIVQRHTVRSDGFDLYDVEVRWNVRMKTTRSASAPDVTGTARYRSVNREYIQPFSDSPVCLLSTTTREGDLPITYYSGSYNGNDSSLWGLGGYFLAAGTVTSTYVRTDCVGNPTESTATYPEGASTARGLGNYINNTLPTLVYDADGNVTSLTWNFHYDNGRATDEVTGQVTRAP